jgi:hypothetical protein
MPAGLPLCSPPPWLPVPPGGAAGAARGRALCGRTWGDLAAEGVGLPPQRAAVCVALGVLAIGPPYPPSVLVPWWQHIKRVAHCIIKPLVLLLKGTTRCACLQLCCGA